jgi:hypothetical protein
MNYQFDPKRGCCGGHGPQMGDSFLTRRKFLARCGMGFGALSLAGLTGMGLLPGGNADAADAVAGPLAPKSPHFPAKAKRVLHIFAAGAPSQLDTWDPKPDLARYDSQSMPDDPNGVAFASPFTFQKMGKSGIDVSEVFPLLGAHVDRLAVVRSMFTEIPDHDTASVMMNTGNTRLIRPSLGSWVTYGLGSENQNMPGFIALGPGGVQAKYIRSAFLPGVYQGTSVNTQYTEVEKLIENIKNGYTSQPEQRRQLDLLNQLNEEHSQNLRKDAELEARLQAFEMAYQMQAEATDAFDISKEPEAMRKAYGADTQQGRQLLIARRLLERGVRFVQVWHGGWDHHSNLRTDLRNKAAECDKPIAALLTDMAQSGLLNDTLILWGGEFGRSATADGNAMGRSPGRNHNHRAFSVWLAGGGIRNGVVYGKTDEFGVRVDKDPVGVHDLHATILHVLGFDHEKLTFRYSGRDFRLTEVYGNVVKGIVT